MTTHRSAAAATAFSRVCAAPPPFTSQPDGSTWSAPSTAMSNRGSAPMPAKDSTCNPRSRAAVSVATEVATQRRSRPRDARAGSRNATVEPVPSPTVMPFSTSRAAASAATRFSFPSGTAERLQLQPRNVRDPRDRDVCRGVTRRDLRVVRKLALEREDGRHALAPVLLRGREDAELVVHEDIVSRRIPALDVVEFFLLVAVHEHRVRGSGNARSRGLPGLEDGIAVGEDDDLAPGAQPRECLERAGIQTLGVRIFEEVVREREQRRILVRGRPPLLHGAEVVAIAEIDEATLLDLPVGDSRLLAVGGPKVPLEVVPDSVVVEQRVVDVDEEYEVGDAHEDILSQLRHDLGPIGPTRERYVRVGVGWVLVAAVSSVLVAGCGGSGSSQTVNGCHIEAGTSCSGANLSGADLSGADLSRADLTGANLDGTNLSDADLSEANLSNAHMQATNLSGADLTSANLTGATISDTDLEGATLCGTTRTDGTTDDSECPASTETTDTETTESTTTEAGAAEVTSFDVGDLKCGAATTAPVAVTWTTTNATAVEIAVDAFSPKGFGPSGTTTVVVPCDDESHTITITPQSDAGTGAPETKSVSAS